MKKFLLAMTMLLALAMTVGCGGGGSGEKKSADSKAKPELVVKMLDVGQGDSVLIRTKTQTILIDTSDVGERDKLKAALAREQVHTIDKLIITHPHADHLGGASVVFDACEVKRVYDNGQPHTSKIYRDYLKAIKAEGAKYKSLKDGDKLDFGDGATFTVLSPTAAMVKEGGRDESGKINYNINSIEGRLTYGQHFAMMFTGDGEAVSESGILKRHKADELASDLLKSPHHASKTSSSPDFLKAVSPKLALISCGAGNSYHHPHPSTLNKYKKQKIQWYRTDVNGAITIGVDANGYVCQPEKGKQSDDSKAKE